MEPTFRCGTRKAIDELAEELNLPNEKWMQDWPYEVVNASDIEKYIDTERGCYHTLDYYPFPICKNNDELYNKIINFDDKKYLKDVNSFLRKVNCYEKGDASKKVVDKMNKLIK